MVVMNTRRTVVNLINNNKTYNTKIMGIKADSASTAKDIALDDESSEMLNGAKTVKEGMLVLNNIAEMNKIEAARTAKVSALIY